MDFDLCAPTRLVFFFHTDQPLLVDFGLCAPTRLVFFYIGQPLLVDFSLCAHVGDNLKKTRQCW